VAAIHRAKWLAQHVFTDENDRILFTTFTRNLAADIRDNLGKLCAKEVLRRIEVVNLDQWVAIFLKRIGYDHEIDYTVRGDAETGERSLLYVAATRAKKEVVATCFGKGCRFLDKLETADVG